MDFELVEGSAADAEAAAHIFVSTIPGNAGWAEVMANVKASDQLTFFTVTFKQKLSIGDRRLFLMREVLTGKIVAYAMLAHPCKLTPEQLAISAASPPLPQNLNVDLMQALRGAGAATTRHGYDSEKHFHNRGLFVLPDYQGHGLGTRLSRRCNDVVDAMGGTIYVSALPTSKRMLLKMGFRHLEEVLVEVKKGAEKAAMLESYSGMVREPSVQI